MRFAEALGSVEGESTAEAINVKDSAVHVEEETDTDSIVSGSHLSSILVTWGWGE